MSFEVEFAALKERAKGKADETKKPYWVWLSQTGVFHVCQKRPPRGCFSYASRRDWVFCTDQSLFDRAMARR